MVLLDRAQVLQNNCVIYTVTTKCACAIYAGYKVFAIIDVVSIGQTSLINDVQLVQRVDA